MLVINNCLSMLALILYSLTFLPQHFISVFWDLQGWYFCLLVDVYPMNLPKKSISPLPTFQVRYFLTRWWYLTMKFQLSDPFRRVFILKLELGSFAIRYLLYRILAHFCFLSKYRCQISLAPSASFYHRRFLMPNLPYTLGLHILSHLMSANFLDSSQSFHRKFLNFILNLWKRYIGRGRQESG